MKYHIIALFNVPEPFGPYSSQIARDLAMPSLQNSLGSQYSLFPCHINAEGEIVMEDV